MTITVTAAIVKQWIVNEIGDADTAVLLASDVLTSQRIIDDMWDRYADKALIAPRLQELYCKRAAVDELISVYRQQLDFKSPDLTVNQDQLTEHLQSIRSSANAEIKIIEARARANRVASAAVLTTTAPEAPPSWWLGPDANWQRYRGDPYRPSAARVIR